MKFLIVYSILSLIKNDIKKIKWKTITTDFEFSLYTSFFGNFNNIPDIKHNGCLFHYLKNIRKFLIKNGYTKKINKTHYE